MALYLQLILPILFVLHTRGQTIVEQSNPFTHSAILDTHGKVELRWKYDDTYIVFEMKTQTIGWMAIGISPSGSMAGADIAVMWIESGNAVLKDMNSEVNGLPSEDTKSNDLDLISSQVIDQSTVVTFGRKLTASCDKEDFVITEDTLRVIYAYGTSIPSSGSLTYADKHLNENRGSKSLRLLGTKSLPNPTDEGIEVLEVKNDNVLLPTEQTYYHCRIHQLNLGGRKNHVVKMEPTIQPGNEIHYHHVLVYLCSGFTSSEHANAHGQECYSPNMPDEYGKCRSLIFAWAIGGTKLVFPNNVGLLLDDSSGPIFIMTENHYDNPGKVSGITDSSGIKIHYTPNLRANDAGIIMVGENVSPLHFIPAGQEEWTTFSECNGQCIANSFQTGQESIKIFATILHSHLFGVKLKLRHFRNGVELKPLSVDKYYDFNYQEFHMHETEIEFQKGDGLAVECIYDTSNSNVPIFGGDGTEEEMCIAFIQYYPKIDVHTCWSSIDQLAAAKILSVDENLVHQDYYGLFIPAFKTAVSELSGNQTTLNEQVLAADYYEWCNDNHVYNPKPHTVYMPYLEQVECGATGSNLMRINMFTVLVTVGVYLPNLF